MASVVRAVPLMGTIVRIEVPAGADSEVSERAIQRGFDWFRTVEKACNRFDPQSELRRLCANPGVPTQVSPMLFEAVRFGLAVAEETDGAFDPTVGVEMEGLGYARDYRSGASTGSGIGKERASFRDVRLDEGARTVLLRRPLLLDMGAVAKGLAVDLAAKELRPCGGFCVDAGGDLYVGGRRPGGGKWSVGIRNPQKPDEIIESVEVSDEAVCTSGDYERGHHHVDPRTGVTATTCASSTVVAPSAMVADALATAAFVLGPRDGIGLLERHGVRGIVYSAALARFSTSGSWAEVRRRP